MASTREAELLGAFGANQDSDRGNLSAKIRMAKARLNGFEKYLEDVANAGNHSEAADLQYGAIPEQRAVIKELEAQKAAADLNATGQDHNAMGTDVVTADHINEILSRWTDREALGGLSAVAMHYTISRDDTASDHARQQCLLGGWAEKTRWRRSPLSRVEQGESVTRIDGRFGEVTEQTRPEDLVKPSLPKLDPRFRVPPGPVRAQAFSHVPVDVDLRGRGRGRSRLQPQVLSEDSESEDDRRYHRSSRHKTPSPEPLPAGYKRIAQYIVRGGRAIPVPPQTVYAPTDGEDSPPTSRQHRKPSNSGSAAPILPPRQSSYSSSAYFPKVKTARYEDVQYSDIPHRYREEYTAYA